VELPWDDSYEIGIPQIDEQHKKLFAIIDDLSTAMMRGRAKYVIQATLARLADYTHYHFSSEEHIMEMYGYDDIRRHHNMHELFKRQLAELIIRHQDGEEMVNVDTYVTARDWILSHVTSHTAEADLRLADFIKAHPDGVNTHRAPEDDEPDTGPLIWSR
jgi:hemerythrin